MQAVKHHVQEEEQKLFPLVEREMRGQLDQLGQQMEQRHRQLKQAA